MEPFDPAAIDALRQQGLSYDEIGRQLGTTKDAARGRHVRWLARGAGLSAPRSHPSLPSTNTRDVAGSGDGRGAFVSHDESAGRSRPANARRETLVKNEIDLARAAIAKATRAEIRLKHSLLADEEINSVLAERLMEFDRALQDGYVPSIALRLVTE